MVEQKKLVRPIELTLVTPAGESHRVLMAHSPFVIGRHESCDMVLNSNSVSRLHCQLKLKSFGLTAKDLESRNGTFLDDAPLVPKERVLLKEGSVLKIGKFRLQIDCIHSEVEISEGGALLLNPSQRSPDPFSSSVASVTPSEPETLLAELEQWIVDTKRGRRADHSRANALIPEAIAQVEMAAPDQDSIHSSQTRAATGQEETVIEKLQSTKLSDSTSHGQTVCDSGLEESDESELQRLRLREQLDAMKPRDSKEAAIQALRNLFGHR